MLPWCHEHEEPKVPPLLPRLASNGNAHSRLAPTVQTAPTSTAVTSREAPAGSRRRLRRVHERIRARARACPPSALRLCITACTRPRLTRYRTGRRSSKSPHDRSRKSRETDGRPRGARRRGTHASSFARERAHARGAARRAAWLLALLCAAQQAGRDGTAPGAAQGAGAGADVELVVAATLGHLDVVKRLHANGAKIGRKALDGAAKHGHLDVVKWLCANGAKIDDDTISGAAANGHLDVVKWLHANGAHIDHDTISGAAEHGHLPVVKWLHANGCLVDKPLFDDACTVAAKNGHVDVVKYCHTNGYPIGEDLMSYAAEYGHLPVVEYLHANGCPVGARTMNLAPDDIIKWLCSKLTVDKASELAYHADVVSWYAIAKLLEAAGSTESPEALYKTARRLGKARVRNKYARFYYREPTNPVLAAKFRQFRVPFAVIEAQADKADQEDEDRCRAMGFESATAYYVARLREERAQPVEEASRA
jgi:hypothetical protein